MYPELFLYTVYKPFISWLMNLFTTGDHQGHRQHHPHALQHQSIYDPNIKRLGIPASSLDPTQSKKGLVFLKLFIIIKVIKLIFEETCTVSCESVLFFFIVVLYCGIILWYSYLKLKWWLMYSLFFSLPSSSTFSYNCRIWNQTTY